MIWLHELGQIFLTWRSTKQNRVKTPGEGLFGKIFTEIELKWVFNIQEIFDLMDFLHIVCDPTLVRMGPEWWRWWRQGTWMGSKGRGTAANFGPAPKSPFPPCLVLGGESCAIFGMNFMQCCSPEHPRHDWCIQVHFCVQCTYPAFAYSRWRA